MTSASEPMRTERIPRMLQAVFLRSNRGKEVKEAPPERAAYRTFFKNWQFKRSTKLDETKKKVYNITKDKVLSKTASSPRKQTTTSSSRTTITSSPQSSDASLSPLSGSAKPGDSTQSSAKAIPPPQLVEVAQQQQEEEKPAPEPKTPDYTLQEYFDAMIRERGYNITLVETLQTAYRSTPTPLQMASYGPRMIQIVRSSDEVALHETLSVGLSPNPCNQHGESLLHAICRRGDHKLLAIMMEAGSSLQVCDDFGRTPLADAFWAPNPAFEVVDMILSKDPGLLFMKDRRGSLPLSYVTKKHWPAWFEWFDQNLDRFFPEAKANTFALSDMTTMPPDAMAGSNEPKAALNLELITMVASGEMTPGQARIMAESGPEVDETTVANTDMDESSFMSEDDEDLSEYDSEYDSDEDSYDSDLDMEEDEMMELMQLAQVARAS